MPSPLDAAEPQSAVPVAIEHATPRVAVLLPTHNAADFVDKALHSLGCQDYRRLQILISDDASSDATSRLCEAFAAEHRHSRFYPQSRRLGWVENVNFLLRQADAEYVIFACHDDVAAPSYVSKLVSAIDHRPGAVLAYSDGEIVDYDGVRSAWKFADIDGARTRLQRARSIAQQKPNWPVAYHGLVRTDAARRVGGLRRHAGGEFGADLPWLLHLALLGDFVRVGEPLFTKICRSSGLANTWSYGPQNQLAVAQACAAEIRRAAPPGYERGILYADLTRTMLRMSARAVRNAMRRAR